MEGPAFTDMPEQNKPDEKRPFNQQKMINAIVIAELILLIVFGWQIFSIKQQLPDREGQAARSNYAIYTSPIKQNEKAPKKETQAEGAAPRAITIKSDDHIRGNVDAPVTIVEYSDFECPFCARAHLTMQQLFDLYPNEIRLVYRHFPLASHARAELAAEAAECAGEQDKFWEMHDLLFDRQEQFAGGAIIMKEWAAELGLDQERFDNCLDQNRTISHIKNERLDGSQRGVSGTPAFFVNGQLISGSQPLEVFQEAIEEALDQSSQ